MAIPTPILLLSSILALLPTTSTAVGSNVMLSGDVIPTEGQLTYNDYSFVMQGDCNLVLYNPIAVFESNTHGNGDTCSLTLDDHGRFVIRSSDGTPRWASTPTQNTTKRGNYAAVLRPDGEVVVYGPAVWSTPDFHFMSTAGTDGVGFFSSLAVTAKNVMFSSQVMYDNATLTTRDYTLIMRDDCSLALLKAHIGDVWGTGTMGRGRHCFLRLSHRGQLAIKDDEYRSVWESKGVATEGDYVLVLQINGQAVIYGPAVWSTSSG